MICRSPAAGESRPQAGSYVNRPMSTNTMPPTPTTKIIVIDDDPTGSQTVHGCLLLTRWDVDTLARR